MIEIVIKKEIVCWIMVIGGVLAFLSPIIAKVLMYFEEKRK